MGVSIADVAGWLPATRARSPTREARTRAQSESTRKDESAAGVMHCGVGGIFNWPRIKILQHATFAHVATPENIRCLPKEKPLKNSSRLQSSTLFCAAACTLLALSACGGEAGSPDAVAVESLGQGLAACTPQPQPVVLATASSQQAAAFAAKYAIDGVSTTRWSSNTAADQSLTLDLGKLINVSGLNINWQTAYSKAFRIERSSDAATWSPVIASASGATAKGLQSITLSTVTRYLRIHSTQATSWGNVSIVDLTVIGTVDSDCGNLLNGPWLYTSADFSPVLDPATTYAISGNRIDFKYSGKSFLVTGSGISGAHFTQPVSVVQSGSYRLRLDVSNSTGASTAVFWASISGAVSPTEFLGIDGLSNPSGTIDFTVSSAPGSNPVIELINKPITVFPGVGVQDFTVTATLTKTN